MDHIFIKLYKNPIYTKYIDMHIGPNVNIQKCIIIKKKFRLQRAFLYLFSRILASREKGGGWTFFYKGRMAIRGDGLLRGWLIPLYEL